MKPIKEKAEDIQLGYDDIQAPAIGRGFVLGANYVLEEIEKQLDEFSNFEDSLIVRRVIEQLKK